MPLFCLPCDADIAISFIFFHATLILLRHYATPFRHFATLCPLIIDAIISPDAFHYAMLSLLIYLPSPYADASAIFAIPPPPAIAADAISLFSLIDIIIS
jgi:hypothetical protein